MSQYRPAPPGVPQIPLADAFSGHHASTAHRGRQRTRRPRATRHGHRTHLGRILRRRRPRLPPPRRSAASSAQPTPTPALPEGAGLAAYDGVIFTGSTLKVAERSPEVMRQRDLMQAGLEAGLPVFGSCWGVQLAAVVAGGDAGPNPRGPEYGFARRIAATAEGRDHPLLSGRGAAWDAPAIHSDAVIVPPSGARVLAANALLDVQAIEIPHGNGVFWGTQYHPELDLDELAAMLRVCAEAVVEAGLAPDAGGRLGLCRRDRCTARRRGRAARLAPRPRRRHPGAAPAPPRDRQLPRPPRRARGRLGRFRSALAFEAKPQAASAIVPSFVATSSVCTSKRIR